jgi:hypothetical protein
MQTKADLSSIGKACQGFLPASQLKEENYPRVEDGDKDKIMRELKKLIGKRISVTIISAIPKEGKLIFSEKDGGEKVPRKFLLETMPLAMKSMVL